MGIRATLFGLMFAAGACGAAAPDESQANVKKAETPEQFAAVAAEVRQEMQSGGHYEYIKASDKRQVDTYLDRMAEMIQKAGSVPAMKEQDKVALFNLQEKLNGILASNASDRLICKHEAPVGSHIPVNTCRTYAETMRQNRETEKWIRDNLMRPNAVGDPQGSPSPGGSGH